MAKVSLEAHALGDPKRRDDAPLNLLAGLAGSFARPPILPARLIEVSNESITLNGERLKQGQQFFEGFCCLLDLVNESRPIHIVIFHDIPE